MGADTPNHRKPLIERLHARSKAWADLWEVASHIGVFPLDCCMIDSPLGSRGRRRDYAPTSDYHNAGARHTRNGP